MSTQIMLKITLTSVLFLALLLVQSWGDNRTLDNYLTEGICEGRSGKFAMAECSQYLECKDNNTALHYCSDTQSGTIYNKTSKTCVKNTTPPCNDQFKVIVFEWDNLVGRNKDILQDGKMPLMPATKNIRKNSFENVTKQWKTYWNSDFDVLLKTRFLAVNDGPHSFYSKCVSWCKVWIRKDICDTPVLVLEQESWSNEGKVKYSVQKNYTMEFATFYYLDVVYHGKAKHFKFLIGVKMPGGTNSKSENIPSVLLQLPGEGECSQQPMTTTPSIQPSRNTISITRSSTPNTASFTRRLPPNKTISNARTLLLSGHVSSTKLLASPTKLGVLTSPISSQSESSPPSVMTQTSVIIKPTPSQQSAAASSSTITTSPKSAIEHLSEKTDENLKEERNNPSPQFQLGGMSEAWSVDMEGQQIAKSWNHKGKAHTVRKQNVVMEVSFPVSSYTFPSQNITNKTEEDFNFDQIHIPAHALKTKGEFNRKVFSALYYNLNDKIPQFFNVVETETNQIRGSYQLNSHVIASTAVPKISITNYDIVIRLAHLQTNFSPEIKPLCVFFKWSNDVNSDGVWSTEGCILDKNLSNANVSVCRCNHLTHFGILINVGEYQVGANDAKALKIITYIGCALSLIGVSLTVLAIMCLPGARSDRNFIHVNLAVAIGLAQITFLAGIDETGYDIACTIIAAMLHYFLLVAFAWMLIEGIFLHILIVKVFHDHLPKKRSYVTFCWGLPFVIVLLSVSLLRDGYGTKTSCWLSTDKSTIWTFSGPAILVMIINIIILCKVMNEISSLRSSDRQDSNVRSVRYGVRSTIILLPLLGLTWAFGLLCVNDNLTVFQYLFTIFNSLQGLFIFLFHCVFNTEVRKAFWRKVDIWFTNHNNPFGNNVHSRLSFKKCKDDPSSMSSPDNAKQTSQKNGLSMYSFNDLTERERRKFSTATASTCLDPWPHKLSLTPSVDGPYPSRFTPSLSSEDIKYQPIFKHDAGQKRISPKSIKIKVEDLNENPKQLDNDRGLKEESCQSFANNKCNPNGENSVQNNDDETNLVKSSHLKQPDKEQEEKRNRNLNLQTSFQNPEKPNEVSCIQKQSQHDCNGESNQRTFDKTQQQRLKNPSRDPPGVERSIGIGGQQLNSGDGRGRVTKIDVDNTLGSLGTKL